MEIRTSLAGVLLVAASHLQSALGQQSEPPDSPAATVNPHQPPTDAQSTATKPQPAFAPTPADLPPSRTATITMPPALDLAPIHQQLTAIQNDMSTLKKQNWIKELIPLAVVLVTMYYTTRNLVKSLNQTAELNRQALQAKVHEEERKAIREKRDKFYGPFTQLRGISQHLYEVFNARRSAEERAQFADKDGKFRTLIALCRGHTFTGVDKVLLEEIVRIGNESASLITKEIGLVDNPKLQEELSRAGAHYSIIQLAAEGKLVTDGDEFDRYTFPHEVDTLIQEKIAALDARLHELEPVAPTRGQPS